MSAITRAYAVYKGSQYNGIYDPDTQKWKFDFPSGPDSSWGEDDHMYPVEIHAIDAAGNETVMTSADPTYGDQLEFRVTEDTKPTATITSPTQGSVLGSATQDIKMELQDAGGSGLNMSTVVFKINNVQISSGLSWSDSDGKKVCTYHATNLSDGQNVISCYCPLSPHSKIDHLLLPDIGLAFLTENRFHDLSDLLPDRRIHAKRFLDTETLRRHKKRLSFNQKAASQMVRQASAVLGENKELHDQMEAIYLPAMDFSMMDALLEQVVEQIIAFQLARETAAQ